MSLVLVIQILCDFVELSDLLSRAVCLLLQMEALFSELPDLYFIILGIEQLSLILTQLDTQELHFPRQPLDLDSLEYHDKVDVISEAGLLIVG